MSKRTDPIMAGVVCRMCGAERIQRPWDVLDGFVCRNCGVTNWPPLLELEIET